MTKEEEIEQIELNLMLFAQSVGEYGNTLNIDEARNPATKIAFMSMQRILEDCYNDLEKELNLLK
tara:strand:+ start:157 stop:351 length:195 start_codon:yes stop_codon:yes gene_type:complete